MSQDIRREKALQKFRDASQTGWGEPRTIVAERLHVDGHLDPLTAFTDAVNALRERAEQAEAERDELRRRLDIHLADENSAQARLDELLHGPDEEPQIGELVRGPHPITGVVVTGKLVNHSEIPMSDGTRTSWVGEDASHGSFVCRDSMRRASAA